MLVLADHSRGLKPARMMQSFDDTSEKAGGPGEPASASQERAAKRGKS
jgi:hypothetical protein